MMGCSSFGIRYLYEEQPTPTKLFERMTPCCVEEQVVEVLCHTGRYGTGSPEDYYLLYFEKIRPSVVEETRRTKDRREGSNDDDVGDTHRPQRTYCSTS